MLQKTLPELEHNSTILPKVDLGSCRICCIHRSVWRFEFSSEARIVGMGLGFEGFAQVITPHAPCRRSETYSYNRISALVPGLRTRATTVKSCRIMSFLHERCLFIVTCHLRLAKILKSGSRSRVANCSDSRRFTVSLNPLPWGRSWSGGRLNVMLWFRV